MPPETTVNLRTAARTLACSPREIVKLLTAGTLRGEQRGKNWQISTASLNAYVQARATEANRAVNLIEDLDQAIMTNENLVPLSRLTNESLMILELDTTTLEGVLHELSHRAHSEGLVASQEELYDQLAQREKMLSTGIGNGVGLPHARTLYAGLFKKSCIIIARTSDGINFNARDRKPVHIFFLVCATSTQVHIRLLSKIAQLLSVPTTIARLKKASDAAAIMQVLLEFERLDIARALPKKTGKKS